MKKSDNLEWKSNVTLNKLVESSKSNRMIQTTRFGIDSNILRVNRSTPNYRSDPLL